MKRIALVFIVLASAGFTRETIDIDGFHCGSLADQTIVCTDTGPTCRAIREAKQKREDRIFGCVDPNSKNYPCPPDENLDKVQERWHNTLEMECQTTIHRSLKCTADLQQCGLLKDLKD